jgi:hypothetical protein
MTYKVLIVVKDGWFSDQREFSTFPAALRHRKDIAKKWSDCETAIGKGERVMAFRESERFLAEIAELRREEKR